MASKVRTRDQGKSLVKTLIIGLSMGMLFVLGGGMLAAYLILQDRISIAGAGLMMSAVLFAAAFMGGLLTSKLTARNAAASGMIYAGAFILVILIIDMLFLDGISALVWGRAVAVLLGAILSVALCHVGGKKKSFKKIRSR